MPIFDKSNEVELPDPHTGEPAIPEPGHEPYQVEADIHTDETAEEIPEIEQDAVQVETDVVTFVAQEDFEGRINQDDFKFTKGTRYFISNDQANFWVDAGKGYIAQTA